MWVDLRQIRPSRWQPALFWAWLSLVLVLLWAAGLSWGITLLASVALLVLLGLQQYWQQRQPQLQQLQQLDRVLWQWQQVFRRQRTGRPPGPSSQTRMMQAKLLRVDAWLGVVVILQFEVTALATRQTWLIWRDQVDPDNWRRLQVLQQYWAAPDPS